jgi:exodeoxyribonuclease-3
MKIITWNVNGIRAVGKKGFLPFVERERPDALCLQETKAHPDQVPPEIAAPCGLQGVWASAMKKGYSGVATFTPEPPLERRVGMGIEAYDNEGRVVITDHRDFLLYNIYFPNGGSGEERHNFKQKFLADLNDHLRGVLKKREVILVGDYNVAYLDIDVHDPVRLSKMSGFLPEEREWFRSFLDLGFTDAFRHFYPDRKDIYSWWDYRTGSRPINRGWRIDHICVSNGLKTKLKACEILDQVEGSDHCPIRLEIETSLDSSSARGAGR